MCNKEQSVHNIEQKSESISDFYIPDNNFFFKKKTARTKLWQLDHNYHCAVIGTCLSLKEVKNLLTSLRVDYSHSNAYDIHTLIVTMISYNDYRSKKVQSYLDKKFATVLKKVKKMNGQELRTEWKNVLTSGNLVGTFWAIISHPLTDEQMKRDFYGDIHMLSHLSGASNRVDLKRLDHLEKDQARLLKAANIDQKKSSTLKDSLLTEKNITQQLKEDNTELMHQLAQLEKQNQALLQSKNNKERQKLNLQIVQLNQKVSAQNNEQEKQQKMIEQLSMDTAQQQKINLNSASEVIIYKEEAEYLQSLLSQQKERDDCQFKKQTLCGQCVLYVGGKKNLIPYYRDLIEQKAGTFLHHDGGEEKSTQGLSQSLARADIVVFPSDCISHSAYWNIKRVCQKQQKPFEYLNSAGLHSLSCTLDKISHQAIA